MVPVKFDSVEINEPVLRQPVLLVIVNDAEELFILIAGPIPFEVQVLFLIIQVPVWFGSSSFIYIGLCPIGRPIGFPVIVLFSKVTLPKLAEVAGEYVSSTALSPKAVLYA